MARLDTTKRIVRQKVSLTSDKRTVMFSPLVLSCPMFVTDDASLCRTACTDGYNIWFYDDFVKGLTDGQLRYLIMHTIRCIATM